MTTRYIKICACEKHLFRVGRVSLRVRECTQVHQTANLLLLSYQNMFFVVFLISTKMKRDLPRIVKTLHHANLCRGFCHRTESDLFLFLFKA